MNATSKIIILLYVLTYLAACGGGGGGVSQAPAVPQTTSPSTTALKVTVSTSLSVGGQVSASEAIIDAGTRAEFTITPNANYLIDSVSGCNGTLNSNTYVTGEVAENCTVLVSFLYVNQVPLLTTTSLQVVDEFESAVIEALASDTDGSIASYRWVQTSGKSVAIDDASSPTISFSIPPILEDETLIFSVTVSDDKGAQASANATIIAQHTNLPPVVNVLGDTSVNENSVLTLSAVASDHEGDITGYVWSQTQGEPLTIQNGNTATLTVKIPELAENQQASFQVRVSDENGAVANDTITISMIDTSIAEIDTQAPASVQLVGVTALSSSQISVDWLETTDNSVSQNSIAYGVHISEQAGFQANASNSKVQLSGQASAVLNDLLPDTTYYLVISAQDSSSNTSYSQELSVTTMATEPVVNANQVIRTVNTVAVLGSTLTYPNNAENPVPAIGDIIVSASQNGILRRVTGVNVNGSTIEVETDIAALNEMYDDVDINTTIKLIDIPQTRSQASSKKQATKVSGLLASKSIVNNKNSLEWQRSGLVLSQTTLPSTRIGHDVKTNTKSTDSSNASTLVFESANESGSVNISGNGQYQFEPALNIAAKIENAALNAAHTKVQGLIDLQLNVGVIANAPGSVSGTTELMRKSFSKTLNVGGSPVVMHGDFILSAKFNAVAQGPLDVEQALSLSYEFEAGFEYIDGNWLPLFTGTPSMSHELVGGAKSQVRSEFTLIPEIQLRVYETDTANIQLEPLIYSEIALEGEFTEQSASDTSNTTFGSYSFTKFDAGASTHLELNASFHAFDRSVATWPLANNTALMPIEVLALTQLHGIPNITLQESSLANSLNSCELSATAVITPFTSSLPSANTSNDWNANSANWRVALISGTDETLSDPITANLAFSSSAQFIASQLAQYKLRFALASELGAWAVQNKEIMFDLRDNNNDSLPDYWANKYALTSQNGGDDNDNDGISNQDEFLYCTFPNKNDSDNDGISDGWEIANALNPTFNDANADADNDNRSNLQEYLDGSNPQVVDINEPPTVDAGQAQSVNELSAVSLLASAHDNGSISSVMWTQISGPLIGLDSVNTQATSFIAPSVSETTVLSFEFTATDNSGALSSSQVDITVNPIAAINIKPSAFAGDDLLVTSGELVSLNASDSFDTNGTISAYQWSALNQQALTFNNPTALTTTFIAPEVVTSTTFTVLLMVTDNDGESDTDQLEIQVNPSDNSAPLSRVLLGQLNDKVVLVRDTTSEGLHTTFALYLAATQADARVYLSAQYINANTSNIETLTSEAALSWQIDDNTLTLQSPAFGTRSLVFSDGSIDVNESVASMGGITVNGADTLVTNETGINPVITELYKRNILISDDLTGHRFTTIANGTNTFIDFVTSSRAFIYSQGSDNIQSIAWSYTNDGENGDYQLQLAINSEAPSIETHASFSTWDSVADFTILDISVLPTIINPLDELVFTDDNLKQCVQNAAIANNWLSTNEVVSLDCSALNIVNARGIEGLTALEDLDISGNRLVNIDLSHNNELRLLDLSNNQLNSIDFTNNPLLSDVNLTNNNLSNAAIRYLSSISFIDDLSFDDRVIEPNGSDFVMLVTVDALQDFTILTDSRFDYDYTVDWGDGTVSSHTEDVTHNYAHAGAYEVIVSGEYPAFRFCADNNGCSDFKIDIVQWGGNEWQSMTSAFLGLTKFNILATDAPDLRFVTDLSFMFYKTPNFNADISSWDLSSVTNMSFMFGLAASFNGDISQWDTSQVSNMSGLFYLASAFNGDISQWNTSKVIFMQSLFAFASSFNTDISQWDTSSVTQMTTMFLGASAFNGNLSLWDVGMVSNMNKMFYNATNMSGNLSTWNVTSGLRHSNFSHEESQLIEPNWLD